MSLYKGTVSLPGFLSKGSTQIENIYKGSTLVHQGGPERVFLYGAPSGVAINGMYKWNGVAHSASPNGGRKYTHRQRNSSGVEVEAPGINIFRTNSITPEWTTIFESQPLTHNYISDYTLTSWYTDGGPGPAPGGAVSYNPNAEVMEFVLSGGAPGTFAGSTFIKIASNPFEFEADGYPAYYTFLDSNEDYVVDAIVLWDDNAGEPVFACSIDSFPGGPWFGNSTDGDLTGTTPPVTSAVALS